MGSESGLKNLDVLGVHRVEVSPEEFEFAVKLKWIPHTKSEWEQARQSMKEHFDGLRLIEIRVEPADAEPNWSEIVQRDDSLPRSNWQVPYDETLVNETQGTWAFFLHFVDENKALSTPVGDRKLPNTTPCPAHLKHLHYDIP